MGFFWWKPEWLNENGFEDALVVTFLLKTLKVFNKFYYLEALGIKMILKEFLSCSWFGYKGHYESSSILD